MSLEQDTINAEPLLSFTVRKMEWKMEQDAQKNWTLMLIFFVLVAFITLTWIRAFFFHYLRQGTASLEYYYFVLHGHKKRRCFWSKRWLSTYYILMKIEIKFTFPCNKQLKYVFYDLHISFYLNFSTLVKLGQSS